jgi:hypothetical protein
VIEEPKDLAAPEDRREVMRPAGPLQVEELEQVQVEYSPVEEDESVEGLVLRGSGDPALDGEMVEERGGLGGAKGARVAATMEGDEDPRPMNIRLLGARGVRGAREKTSTRDGSQLPGGDGNSSGCDVESERRCTGWLSTVVRGYLRIMPYRPTWIDSTAFVPRSSTRSPVLHHRGSLIPVDAVDLGSGNYRVYRQGQSGVGQPIDVSAEILKVMRARFLPLEPRMPQGAASRPARH